MGFCLQRSVHILSRTPLGSPCPAFPWPRRRLFSLASFSFPSRFRFRPSVFRPSFACSRLPMACPFSRTAVPSHGLAHREPARFVPPVSGCPAPAVSAALLALEPRFRVPEFQESSPGHARFLGACVTRLPSSHLSWLFRPPGIDSADLGLDFASHSPHVLAFTAQAWPEPQGLDRSLTAASEVCVSASFPLPRPPGLLTLLPWPATSEFAPAGLSFHLRARSALPPRHPPVFAGSSFLRRAFLPERIRSRLSGHW